MFRGKKVVIFDMDGTLIDSVGVWNEVDKSLIKKLGCFDTIELNEIQKQRDNALRNYSTAENPYLEYARLLKEKYKSNLSEEEIIKLRYEIAQNYLQNIIDYKKDAEKLLKKLKRCGMQLVIATTTKKTNMNIYRTENKNIISKAMIDEYFTLVYTREDAQKIKPNPEIHIKVMEQLGVRPEECIIFEDSLIGIEAAKNAGIEVVAIYDKYSDNDRSKINELSNYQCNNYTEIIEQLEREIPILEER